MLLYKFLASAIHGKNISKISLSILNDKFKLSHELYSPGSHKFLFNNLRQS